VSGEEARVKRAFARRRDALWCGGALAVMLLLAFPTLAQAPAAPDLERARKIVSGSCFLCHGTEGEAGTEVFPKLAAQHPEYIAKQLANFQSGARTSSAMAGMIRGLSDADFVSLGAYFSRQPPTAHDVEDPSAVATGKVIYLTGNPASGVAACVSCHGDNAAGSAALPRLAGQHPGYLETQLKQFHTRERTNDNAVMQEVSQKMTPREIRSVAEYLSSVR
jgi:cytochrome c553